MTTIIINCNRKMKMFITHKRLTAKDKINILLSSYGSLTDFRVRT
jgi:hypothetical protein